MSPTNERDAGFCSGSSENEEDLDHHHHLQMRLINSSSECSNSSQSAQSSSEDSSVLGDSKFVLPIPPPVATHTTTTTKNKRKSSEPIRVVSELQSSCGPIKKRFKLETEKMLVRTHVEQPLPLTTTASNTVVAAPLLSPDPFRPWTNLMGGDMKAPMMSPAHSFKRHPGVTTLHRVPGEEMITPKFLMPVQEEPIALLVTKKQQPAASFQSPVKEQAHEMAIRNLFLSKQKLVDEPRPAHIIRTSRTPSLIDETSSTASSFVSPATTTLNLSVKAPLLPPPTPAHSEDHETSSRSGEKKDSSQRNYKNMTRERRIEANARERTRVHTISAAFEKLRHSVPAYSNTQKLSKLSVLRIACSYIMSLSRVAGMDYSEDQSEPPIADCVDALTRTIQTEGKLRKKKDE